MFNVQFVKKSHLDEYKISINTTLYLGPACDEDQSILVLLDNAFDPVVLNGSNRIEVSEDLPGDGFFAME